MPPSAMFRLLLGTLLLGVASTIAPALVSASPAFDVTEATIAQTQQAIARRQTTCRAIVEAYLARIRRYDQAEMEGTRLNSIVTLNPEVLADADRCDHNFAQTHRLLPLSGIAVIVKDNYDTRALQTTGGSLAMKGFLPAADATMVAKLRAAGALILAKSNMAEWAFSPYVTMSSINGTTRNAYDLSRVPAGSSGGTAAAVASSLGEVGLGTDTGNSIRGPSSHNALVGIRPTIGLTSRSGIIPLFANNDVGGPMARTVADAAAVLSVVAGYDPADPVTALDRDRPALDYTRYLDPGALRGARIGVFREYFNTPTTDPQVKAVTEHALEELRAQGAVLVDPFTIPGYKTLLKGLWCGDFQADLNAYLAKHPNAPYHDLASIVDSGLYLPYIEDEMKEAVHPKSPKPGSGERVGQCADVYHDPPKIAFRQAVLAAMDRDHLDAIVYPTWSNQPRKVGDMKSPAGDNSQVLSPQTGFPAITVPMGFTRAIVPGADGQAGAAAPVVAAEAELPAGLTFFGRAFSEAELIRLAYSYEQATHGRMPPRLFPSLAGRATASQGR